MAEKIINTMYIFAIFYLIVGLLAGLAMSIYAAHRNMEATSAIKSLFKSCFFYAFLLFIIAWLLS